MAGVNSFGFGGANAHVILAEPPARPHARACREAGRSRLADRALGPLRGSAARLRAAAWRSGSTNASNAQRRFAGAARPRLHAGRAAQSSSAPPHASSRTPCPRWCAELDAFAVESRRARRPARRSRRARNRAARGLRHERPGTAVVGHGPRADAARAGLPRDHRALRRGDAAVARVSRCSKNSAAARRPRRLQRTEIAQPAIFAMQVALAELWKSWGVQPAAVVGHSVGEIAAACVAGIFSLEEGARIIALRAQFMDGCARGEGTMLAVGLDRRRSARADRAARSHGHASPPSTARVRSRSPARALRSKRCSPNWSRRAFSRAWCRVDHPFHHRADAAGVGGARERACRSRAAGGNGAVFQHRHRRPLSPAKPAAPAHWGRGVRQPVQFAPAVDALADFGVDVWLEIGAHPALAHSIQECLAGRGVEAGRDFLGSPRARARVVARSRDGPASRRRARSISTR